MCLFTVKPSQEGEIFCTIIRIMKFFRGSCSFPYIKTLLKVSDPVFEQKPKPVENFNALVVWK